MINKTESSDQEESDSQVAETGQHLEPTNKQGFSFKQNKLLVSVLCILVVLILVTTGGGAYLIFKLNDKIDKLSEQSVVPGPGVTVIQTDMLAKVDPAAPFLGNPNAKVTLIEFEDFQCPYCKRFFDETFSQIKQNYIDTGKIKFIHEDLPFLGQESFDAALAAHCALDQGKFWEYRDTLFNHQKAENEGDFATANLEKFAVNLGLNSATFNTCLETSKYKDLLNNQSQTARDHGALGTPTFFFNNELVRGVQPYSYFQTKLDNLLK